MRITGLKTMFLLSRWKTFAVSDLRSRLSAKAYDVYSCLQSFGPMTRQDLDEELYPGDTCAHATKVARVRRAITELLDMELVEGYDLLQPNFKWKYVYTVKGNGRPPDYLDAVIKRFEESGLPIKTFARQLNVPRTTLLSWIEIQKRRNK